MNDPLGAAASDAARDVGRRFTYGIWLAALVLLLVSSISTT